MNNSNIHESWNPLFEKWSHTINENLKIYDSSAKIYPPKADVFKVFSLSVHDIKLVLLGQDPRAVIDLADQALLRVGQHQDILHQRGPIANPGAGAVSLRDASPSASLRVPTCPLAWPLAHGARLLERPRLGELSGSRTGVAAACA